MIKEKLKKIRNKFLRLYSKTKTKPVDSPVKLHLGCGNVYLPDWVNIDITNDSAADIVFDYRHLNKLYSNDSVFSIKMIHTISYLCLWEARDFFRMCFALLKKEGTLILEFPDIVKCAKIILENEKKDLYQYMEGIRAVYAFEVNYKKQYTPYSFGWSASHIERELLDVGFTVKISDGTEHNRPERDTRIEAKK